MSPILNKYDKTASQGNTNHVSDRRPKCERWGLSMQLACSSTENHFRPRCSLCQCPGFLMWLPHVHSPARTELGKHFVREKIVNHYFYMIPRTNPSLHPTPTPNTVIWWEQSILDRNLNVFLIVWITRIGKMHLKEFSILVTAAVMATLGLLGTPVRVWVLSSWNDRQASWSPDNVVRPQVRCEDGSRKRK